MKSVTVFNNKGGVGKTTVLCNLAAYLALKKQKKVLVVDADPQCNATNYLFDEKRCLNLFKASMARLTTSLSRLRKAVVFTLANFL